MSDDELVLTENIGLNDNVGIIQISKEILEQIKNSIDQGLITNKLPDDILKDISKKAPQLNPVWNKVDIGIKLLMVISSLIGLWLTYFSYMKPKENNPIICIEEKRIIQVIENHVTNNFYMTSPHLSENHSENNNNQ